MISKPLLFNGKSIDLYAKKESLEKSAIRLKTTVSILKRMINLFNKGGEEAIKKAKWGRGGDRGLYEPIT